MSPSALLAADCYVTRELRVLLVVNTAAILLNERGCAVYVRTGVNTYKAACFLVSSSADMMRITIVAARSKK